MSRPLLTASGLAAARGARILFTGVTFEARAGEAIVLRGANGAGKTTLLRILAGLTQAGAGTVERSVPHHWFGHREGLKPHETPLSHLKLWEKAWGGAGAQAAVQRMGLDRPKSVPAQMLSAGQRRRSALGRLLLVDRPLWLLDEPFSALDDAGRTLVRDLIAEHRSEGGAVVAAIHGEAGFEATREVLL
ncbi:MAG: heme ABC exporter ATP-binding protein CcmA [Pseudomonadota bacterium]